MLRSLPLIALLFVAPGLARAADVHKCRGGAGSPVYQDSPCAAGHELRNFSDDPPSLSIIPFARESPAARAATESARSRRAAKPAHAPRDHARPGPMFDAAQRRHLSEGMTEGEVRARIGPPDQRGREGKHASWTYLPSPEDAQTVTLVIFDKGRVARIERKIMR